jgi:ankyrin repeat protein
VAYIATVETLIFPDALVQFGAPVNDQDNAGQAALYLAASAGTSLSMLLNQEAAVRVLLENGTVAYMV